MPPEPNSVSHLSSVSPAILFTACSRSRRRSQIFLAQWSFMPATQAKTNDNKSAAIPLAFAAHPADDPERYRARRPLKAGTPIDKACIAAARVAASSALRELYSARRIDTRSLISMGCLPSRYHVHHARHFPKPFGHASRQLRSTSERSATSAPAPALPPPRRIIRRARARNPWPRGNCGRPRQTAHRRRRRDRADAP